jgi:hypothetical protein
VFLLTRCFRYLRPWIAAALTILGGVSAAATQESNPAPSPMTEPAPFDGIELTATQRAAIAQDWEHRKHALSAIVERLRSSGRITDADRVELRRFAEARNAVVRRILTSVQQAQLDRNLARIAEARRQRSTLRRAPR